MTGRRKGTPCACETDPCSCGSSKGKCVRAVNNVSPDPNGDLVIRGGTGIEVIQSGDDLVINNTANPNAFVAGDNIELIPSGDDIAISLAQDPVINGTLTVNGDIIQNGAAYETHAEKVYSRDDYIIMRDGAIAALAPGDYAGFQVKLYDGVNDGRLVIDSSGVARVGDVGDEQPLMTRDESADLTDGDSLIWDAANSKAVTAAIPSAISTALSRKGINNTVSNNSQSNVNTPASTVTYLCNLTITEPGTYLINIVIGTTGVTSGYVLGGLDINGSVGWLNNQAADNDGAYMTITTVINITGSTALRVCVFSPAVTLTTGATITAVQLI